MNAAIRGLLDNLNARPMKGHGGKCRDELFEQSDVTGYRPLPSQPYEPGQWLLRMRAGRDYHVPVLGNRYSVPSRLANQQVNVKVTTTTVYLSYLGRMVATHVRSQEVGKLVTHAAHMPPAHRGAAMTRLTGIKAHVQDIGPDTVRFIEAYFRSVHNPSDTVKAATKIRALAEQHTPERVEVAAHQQAQRSDHRDYSWFRVGRYAHGEWRGTRGTSSSSQCTRCVVFFECHERSEWRAQKCLMHKPSTCCMSFG